MRFFRWLTLVLFLVSLSEIDLQAIGRVPFKARWVTVIKKGRIFKYKRREYSSPVVFQDLIFTGSDAGFLYAMKKKTGHKIWRFRAEGSINSSPAIEERTEGARLFFGDDKGILYAVDLKKGKEIWRVHLGSEILTAPAFMEGRLFASTVEGRVVALDPGDGRILWDKEHPLQGLEMTIRGHCPPVVDPEGKRLFVGFSDGTFWALSTADGRLAWEKKLGSDTKGFHDIDGAPLLEGDRIFVSLFEGGIYALSKKSGQVLWNQPIGSGVSLASDPTTLYLSGSDGHLYALNKKDGSTKWDLKLGGGALTRPVLYQGLLAVGLSDSTMNFVRSDTGKLLVHRFARKGISSDPFIDDGKIYYFSNGGRLYSLKLLP